ncbi:hypothetical protein NDI56_17545 [Haloarcula sp. S1CR25-12]|uniref:Uncharacterized protein n=1 Tax=Haloarcula saliterrae TaxID=2950534 RepID=A0ABU2FG21_9EURY|nr:hypothetical protein [Haloarcula sp. S1CR25-12]MDS0261207.1 hypothetical protein [Haloarcula sp. S1CR25-12]
MTRPRELTTPSPGATAEAGDGLVGAVRDRLDAYHERVSRSLARLFRSDGLGLYAKLWGVRTGEIEALPEAFLERTTGTVGSEP